MIKYPTTSGFAIGLAACALVASTLIASTPVPQAVAAAPASTPPAVPPPDDPDAGLFALTCNKCHDAARITALRRTGTDWEELLTKMIEKGATGTEKDFETIYEYLLRNFGKVNINNAAPGDIAKILRLSAKDADAIVTYRKTNGPFADFEGVKKVPDIDLKKLDEHHDAVVF